MSYSRLDIPVSGEEPFTEYSRWRLRVSDDGRHTWHYLHTDDECRDWPQTDLDKYWLGLPLDIPDLPPPKDALGAARNGYTFYKHLQADDGHWPGEYGGPMFLLPGLVIGSYVSGMGFTLVQRLEMVRYLINRAHPEDGGWGMYVILLARLLLSDFYAAMSRASPPCSVPRSTIVSCAFSACPPSTLY